MATTTLYETIFIGRNKISTKKVIHFKVWRMRDLDKK